jgi:AraC-like DNA-binding protein
MEEKLAVQPQAWTSLLIEFPTLPKLLADGRESSQRVLFLCPATEKNPTELCLALFGRQIVMQRLQVGVPLESTARLRVAFLYAPTMPDYPARLLRGWGNLDETLVVLAGKDNVVRSARTVLELLANTTAVSGRAAGEPASGLLESGEPLIAGDEVIWEDPLPEIVMVDDDGNLVRAVTKLNDYRAEYACRYVLAHFHENVNRDRMADMVHLSPGYFSNLFRSEVGTSFSDYLIMVRIENAKAMLRRFELSVEAISKKCGFNSLAHFSRTFKDRCGLSPLKYRKSPHVGS